MIRLFGIWVGQLDISMANDLLGLSGVWEEAEYQKILSSQLPLHIAATSLV